MDSESVVWCVGIEDPKRPELIAAGARQVPGLSVLCRAPAQHVLVSDFDFEKGRIGRAK